MRDLPPEPPSSEIRPEGLYQSRREFIKNGVFTLGTAGVGLAAALVWLAGKGPPPDEPEAAPLAPEGSTRRAAPSTPTSRRRPYRAT